MRSELRSFKPKEGQVDSRNRICSPTWQIFNILIQATHWGEQDAITSAIKPSWGEQDAITIKAVQSKPPYGRTFGMIPKQKVQYSSITECYGEYFYIYASIKDLMSLVNLTISFVFNIYEI